MGGNSSKEELSQSKTTNSTDINSTFRQPSPYKDIRRPAIDQSAVIGSVYDAREESFLKDVVLMIRSESRIPQKTPYWKVINSDKFQVESLFDMIGVDEDCRLSMILDMTPQDELSSLIKDLLTRNTLTLVLSYHYLSEEKYISNEQDIIKLNISKNIRSVPATHLVTGIKFGMIVVVVLQLSPEDEPHSNSIRDQIAEQLIKKSFDFTEKRQLLDRFTSIKIFSNLPELCKLTKLADIHQSINKIKLNMSKHRLLEYTLRPISSFVSLDSAKNYEYFPLTSNTINKIEQHWNQLSFLIKSLKAPFAIEVENIPQYLSKKQFTEIQQRISQTQKTYTSRIEEICALVGEMRGGASEERTIAEMQTDEHEKSLQCKIAYINDQITLQEQVQLIERLEKNKIDYWDVKQIVKDNDHDLKTVAKQIVDKGNRTRIFCFDDKLEKPYLSKWNEFYTEMLEERKTRSQLQFVYADFSSCSCQLQKMEPFSSNDIQRQSSSWEKQLSKATPSSSKRSRLDQPNSPTINLINVLLLGESGVGKSTFVNAIVNYFKFESLREARSGRPIVLMPVSFLMTIGDHFEERIVRFGDKDPNEDHNHLGQSVTQQCRSYVFTVGTQSKIRLIDTPGMGDTRGLAQDDLNMQHILSYISNLSHLNAICILLKPNESRLNVVLRSYFSRLIGFLSENVRNNIIFCFTNTRGTFFAPGNTGPLLKKMLESHSIKNIPFKKTNTFCFDNESFRYLVALLDGIEFDDYQKEEYKQSWMTSVNESNRLLQYICSELKPYPQENWQSVEHAYFQITQLTRPMLETIRNTMRNVILLGKTSSKTLIKLRPMHVPQNSRVCLNCKHSELLGEFWIVPDELHVLSDRCNECQCDISRHLKVDYLLKYETSVGKQKLSFNEMKTSLDQLKQMITKFVDFLKYAVRISKENDPILSALERMINEEKYIRSQKGSNDLNSYLYEDLKNLKKDYEQHWTTSASNRKQMTLPEIYNQIKNVSANRTIQDQMEAIKQTQEIYMTEQEKHVA